ncbi:MAG: hypothetical protein RLY14_1433, partial [Planctomycetota bacterium]
KRGIAFLIRIPIYLFLHVYLFLHRSRRSSVFAELEKILPRRLLIMAVLSVKLGFVARPRSFVARLFAGRGITGLGAFEKGETGNSQVK